MFSHELGGASQNPQILDQPSSRFRLPVLLELEVRLRGPF